MHCTRWSLRRITKLATQPIQPAIYPHRCVPVVGAPAARSTVKHPARFFRCIRRGEAKVSVPQIIQEFRGRIDTRYQQVIPCTSAGDVQQVPFGVVDLFEVRVVRDRFDPLL